MNEAEPFAVEFQFHEDENARNEALEERLRESVAVKTTTGPCAIKTFVDGLPDLQTILPETYFAVPVHFIEAPSGGFLYVPIADADFKTPHTAVTELQMPVQQVPCVV